MSDGDGDGAVDTAGVTGDDDDDDAGTWATCVACASAGAMARSVLNAQDRTGGVATGLEAVAAVVDDDVDVDGTAGAAAVAGDDNGDDAVGSGAVTGDDDGVGTGAPSTDVEAITGGEGGRQVDA